MGNHRLHCVSVSVRTLCLCLCLHCVCVCACTVSVSARVPVTVGVDCVCLCLCTVCVCAGTVSALISCLYPTTLLLLPRLSHVRWQLCRLLQVYIHAATVLLSNVRLVWCRAQVVSTVAQKHVNWPVRQRHCEQLVQSLLWWCSQKMRARTTDVEFTELSLHPRENYLLCMFFAQITFTHNGL